jgi:hypothetical protein
MLLEDARLVTDEAILADFRGVAVRSLQNPAAPDYTGELAVYKGRGRDQPLVAVVTAERFQHLLELHANLRRLDGSSIAGGVLAVTVGAGSDDELARLNDTEARLSARLVEVRAAITARAANTQ